jgi:adenylate cyclase, class 2
MAIEIEAKMAVESFDAVRATLRSLDAQRTGERFEVNAFFDTAARALLARGEGMRLRLERDAATGQERTVITWKGPVQPGPLKSREEIEFEVGSRDKAAALLGKLGYVRTLEFEKRREIWRLEPCEVVLDEVASLGRFVEVEGPDESAVMSVRERLGLSDRPLIKDGYATLLSRRQPPPPPRPSTAPPRGSGGT